MMRLNGKTTGFFLVLAVFVLLLISMAAPGRARAATEGEVLQPAQYADYYPKGGDMGYMDDEVEDDVKLGSASGTESPPAGAVAAVPSESPPAENPVPEVVKPAGEIPAESPLVDAPIVLAGPPQTVAQSPSARPNCLPFFLHEFKKHPNYSSRVCLYALIVLTRDSKPDVRAKALKQLLNVFSMLKKWSDLGISLDLMKGISNCDIDVSAGLTIGMRVVRFGFSSLIDQPFFKAVFLSSNLFMTDKKQNNYFHLAASSGDISTVQKVNEIFLSNADVTDANILELLQSRNLDGQTPLDIATAAGSTSVVEQLKILFEVVQVGLAVKPNLENLQSELPEVKSFLSPVGIVH